MYVSGKAAAHLVIIAFNKLVVAITLCHACIQPVLSSTLAAPPLNRYLSTNLSPRPSSYRCSCQPFYSPHCYLSGQSSLSGRGEFNKPNATATIHKSLLLPPTSERPGVHLFGFISGYAIQCTAAETDIIALLLDYTHRIILLPDSVQATRFVAPPA
ncbi:unnamed protein product [Protopolystoma xenopodis]|uniref:Uncharacterized protein n=1 Tax=Protopolystoma xenopodis TaxID=117903 RepID=A0A3S5B5F7_9PLAT|nr:unnamed protein product [Protopolystoma xenopodis]